MAIIDAFGESSFDFPRNQIKIGKQMYTDQGLKRYIEEHREAIEPQNAIQKLRTMQKANATCEVLNKDYVVFQQNNSQNAGGELYIGNALAVALRCKEYELAEGLAKSGVTLQNGQSVSVWQNTDGEFIVGSSMNDSVMEILLNNENIPENVWCALWENYAALDYKWGRNRFIPDAGLKTIHKWLKNLAFLRSKYPELWERVTTEEFKCDFLWAASGDKKIMSKQNMIKFCKALKENAMIPEEQTVFWKELTFRYKRVWQEIACEVLYTQIENYFRFWKVLTGQPIVLDWSSSECNELRLREVFESDYVQVFGSDYGELGWWLNHVDIVINSESEDPEKVIPYSLQNDISLLTALKSNLLSEEMLPMAISKARVSAKSLIPLLILKQHGEFEYNWEEG